MDYSKTITFIHFMQIAVCSPQSFYSNNSRGDDVFLQILFQNKRETMMYAVAYVDFKDV